MGQIDVIIPTYKPDKRLFDLLDLLMHQTVPVGQIILMNTEQQYYDQLIYGKRLPDYYKEIKVIHLSHKEFDHGGTRNKGVGFSTNPYFLMMTQDAMPADEFLLERLQNALMQDEKIAVAYARQLPAADAGEVEKLTRAFNYPETPVVKTLSDLPELGIKTFFCSNVCAMYKREIFDELGGFVKHTIFNEDMIYASGAIRAGYSIAYAAQAEVIHSHNYTNKQQYKRNFDLAVSQADHPEVFDGISSGSEGIRMVKTCARLLWKNKMANQIPHLVMQSGFKYLGYQKGKNYRKLSYKRIMKCTSNPNYWKQKSDYKTR